MKFPHLRILIAAIVVFAIAAQVSPQTQKSDNLSVVFGDQTILIPTPEGLLEITGKAPIVSSTFRATEPATNDLLATYITDSDLQRIKGGSPPLMHFFGKVSTLTAARAQDVPHPIFEASAEEFRKYAEKYADPERPGVKELVDNAEEILSKATSGTAKVEVGKPKNLGAFEKSANVCSILMMTTVDVVAGEETIKRKLVVGSSLVYVKQRILFVNAYRTYESDADLETMKQSVSKWTKSILAANETRKTDHE